MRRALSGLNGEGQAKGQPPNARGEPPNVGEELIVPTITLLLVTPSLPLEPAT